MNSLFEIESARELQGFETPHSSQPGPPESTQEPQELTRTELQQELSHLMGEQIRSLEWQSFIGTEPDELERQEERLKRIREISAELILAIRKFSHNAHLNPAPEQQEIRR